MGVVKGIMFLLLMLSLHVYSFEIKTVYGKIYINPPTNCTLTFNNTMINVYTDKVPGLYYGLIKYECGHYSGYLLSKPECIDCGIYCPQNDKMLKCQQFALPYVLGILTAFIFSLFFGIFMHKLGFSLIINAYSNYRDKRRNNRINRYAKYLGKASISTNNDDIVKQEMPLRNICKSSSGRKTSLTSIAVSALVLTADRTYACDRTLFMHSNGQICDKFKCQDINSYSFNIGLGKTICFNTPTRSMMKFQVINTKYISTYQQLYDTSDFEIDLESTSNCKQQGLCFKETCYKDYKHPGFVNRTEVHGYDCDTEGLGCEFMCWHKYACTWYNWWLREVGMKVGVFKRVKTLWSFDLIISYKDIVKRYTFNSDFTQNDLDIGKLFSSDNMPINVNNVISPNYHSDDYVIRDGFSFYYSSANELNVLTPGKIGDYQISLDNKERIFRNSEISCKTTGCKVICTTSEPSIRLFRNTKHRSEVEEYTILDQYTVSTMSMVPMTVNLNIGNVEFKNLYVEQANCDINLLHTFGCIGCSYLPYAVIQSTKIMNHGSLPFISNCTFNTKVLFCTEDLYKVIPLSRYNACNIYIPSLNKSLDIHFNYEFFGDLTIPETLYSQDLGFKGIISSIATNPNFLDTLTYGMFAFTGLGLLTSITVKIVFRWLAIKKIDKIKNDVELSEY